MSSASTLGWFERDLSRGCWTWSAEFYRIHGYQPGEVEPTTALVVQHKHPDDVARAQQVIAAASSGRAFSLYHRIVTTRRRMRRVLTVGEGVRGPHGDVMVVRGYMADISDPVTRDESEAVRLATAARAAVDQARGILIATYGIGAAEALAFLRRWSMQHNVRVVDAAEALIAAFEDRRPGVPVVVSDVLQQLVGD